MSSASVRSSSTAACHRAQVSSSTRIDLIFAGMIASFPRVARGAAGPYPPGRYLAWFHLRAARARWGGIRKGTGRAKKEGALLAPLPECHLLDLVRILTQQVRPLVIAEVESLRAILRFGTLPVVDELPSLTEKRCGDSLSRHLAGLTPAVSLEPLKRVLLKLGRVGQAAGPERYVEQRRFEDVVQRGLLILLLRVPHLRA